MLFVLEQVGQMMVEPAYIAGTGPDTGHKEQRPLRIILSGKGPVHGFHRLLRYAAAVYAPVADRGKLRTLINHIRDGRRELCVPHTV